MKREREWVENVTGIREMNMLRFFFFDGVDFYFLYYLITYWTVIWYMCKISFWWWVSPVLVVAVAHVIIGNCKIWHKQTPTKQKWKKKIITCLFLSSIFSFSFFHIFGDYLLFSVFFSSVYLILLMLSMRLALLLLLLMFLLTLLLLFSIIIIPQYMNIFHF